MNLDGDCNMRPDPADTPEERFQCNNCDMDICQDDEVECAQCGHKGCVVCMPLEFETLEHFCVDRIEWERGKRYVTYHECKDEWIKENE